MMDAVLRGCLLSIVSVEVRWSRVYISMSTRLPACLVCLLAQPAPSLARVTVTRGNDVNRSFRIRCCARDRGALAETGCTLCLYSAKWPCPDLSALICQADEPVRGAYQPQCREMPTRKLPDGRTHGGRPAPAKPPLAPIRLRTSFSPRSMSPISGARQRRAEPGLGRRSGQAPIQLRRWTSGSARHHPWPNRATEALCSGLEQLALERTGAVTTAAAAQHRPARVCLACHPPSS
ncbi:uncharacterized protein B0I36DRAFT_410685 [Microdochium trichocladiopsis]|uniref:Uncharacterized protein n=1 Tax=Microdochium trichocladiopsis TaxID=1682393 RepID=A0A9P9BP82_9PEZI|nr:uncharacterized protein B0I36DRAFT_410685 [Microdochium trichocladiopsis]KAH7029004.1 hypothetical protein B0I36DRAFT_410685 [Microdochium trichocladiopsis]